jgi:hypothetical protein
VYRKNGLKLINLFFGERPGEILQLSNRIPVKPWYKHGRTYIPHKSTVGENLVEMEQRYVIFLILSSFPLMNTSLTVGGI